MKNRLLLLLISLLLTVSLCGQTISVKTCKSCGKPLAQCEYKGKHPTIPSVSFEGEPSSVHIYIDDDYKGTNANAIPISGGNHRVKYSSEGYADLIDEIYISDDPFQTIKYHLYPKKYNVTIKCSVDVKIWVDDEYKGSVPVNIPLSKGQHKLRAVDTNVLYEEHTSTFTVSHDNQVISFDMVKFQANNSSAISQPTSSSSTSNNTIRKNINNPSINCSPDCLSVQSVEASPSRTVLILSYTNNSLTTEYVRPWIQIDRKAYILAEGKKYKLTAAEGIAYAPEHTYFSYEGQTLVFKLIFKPIPPSAKSFDFIEGPSSSWKIFGIRIQ